MAFTFKTVGEDRSSTKTNLYEQVPITGTIASGTYSESGVGSNIKNYSHGMFQSVYDYPYLSSSANHIFDLTVGYSANSGLNGVTGEVQAAKKNNIYNEFAQLMVAPDINGNIRDFDTDGNISAGGTKMRECVFLSFSRLLAKDEIKKGTVALQLYTGGTSTLAGRSTLVTVQDPGGETSYKVNSPAGEYGLLYTGSTAVAGSEVGHVYYQAGLVVLTSSLFDAASQFDLSNSWSIESTFVSGAISASADAIRARSFNLQFNNTTELNSTIYFCRAGTGDYNYSSNPTYLSSSQITVKNVSSDQPVTYITTVGLYSATNELLAVGKLSEPIKKTPDQEVTIRVRLDY